VDVEREAILRERIKAMDPDRFEQLVFELAHRDDRRVERVNRPDGGADTILPRGGGLAERAWQAKHYPKAISWKKCEDSLSRAVTRWKPNRVTFVFPIDLSQTRRASFDKKLVRHPDALGITVNHWNQSHLVQLLATHPDLAARFWPDTEEQTEKIDRLIKAGGKMENAGEMVERALAVGEFADRDKDFETAVSSLGIDTDAPNFETLPYITLEVRGERRRVHIAAWVRDGASIGQSTVSFRPDERGQAARMDAVRTLAGGETATVTDGFQAAIVAPEIVRELIEETQLGPGSFDLLPGDALIISLEIEVDGEMLSYTVPLRPVPPPPDTAAAWAGYIGRTLLEMTFTLLEKPAMRVSVGLHGSLDGTASDRADAATLVHGFVAHKAIRITSDVLFPSADGTITGHFEKFGDVAEPHDMATLRDFFRDVAFIEAELSIQLPLPETTSAEDLDAAATIADVLRTGEGSAEFGGLEATVVNPSISIPDLTMRLSAPSKAVEPVTYDLFGKTIHLGRGEYEIPPLKMVNVAAHGTTPDAPARLTFATEGDPNTTFRLIDRAAAK
jgi:hypothetical protein